MGRKKKPEPDDQEEYERFVKVAKEIQDEEADQRFQDATRQILLRPKKSAEPENTT